MGKMILTDGLCGTDNTTWGWLTNGKGRYAGNRSLKYFNASLPNLTDGTEMFKGCTALSAVEGDGSGTMTALSNATSMFEGSGIVTAEIIPIQGGNATAMYKNCKNLKLFFSDHIRDVNCDSMFEGCSNLVKMRIGIDSWGQPATITSAIKMFKDCTSLYNFEAMIAASGPPYEVEITGSSESMFEGCTELRRFPYPEQVWVKGMTNCKNMFAGCINLRTVYGETVANPDRKPEEAIIYVGMSGAQITKAKGMFGNAELGWCKLDFASALSIAMTITDLTGKTSDGTEEWGKISIGLADDLRNYEVPEIPGKTFEQLLLDGDAEYANNPTTTLTAPDGTYTDIQRAHIARGLRTKGWTVELHGDDITTTHTPTPAG